MAVEYIRVSEDDPCPRCGKPDWCLIHISGEFCICSRVKSNRPAGTRGAGWVHKTDRKIVVDKSKIVEVEKVDTTEVAILTAECERRLKGRRADELVEELGIGIEHLQAMRFGWSYEHEAYTTPMCNARGQVVGLQFRRGKAKWFLKGSRMGLFIPRGWRRRNEEPVFFPEGASDCAALTSIGCFAVGRPNSRVGLADIKDFLERNPRWARGIPSAIFIADNDPLNPVTGKHDGLEGAKDLAYEIPGAIVIMSQTEKVDTRQIVAMGGTKKDIMQVVARKSSDFWKGVQLERVGMV